MTVVERGRSASRRGCFLKKKEGVEMEGGTSRIRIKNQEDNDDGRVRFGEEVDRVMAMSAGEGWEELPYVHNRKGTKAE